MKGKKRNNAVGVKGKSGRKSGYEEYNKTQAINTLWYKLNTKIQANEKLTKFEEKLVSTLLPKTIKTETDVTSGGKELKTLLVKFIDGKDN